MKYETELVKFSETVSLKSRRKHQAIFRRHLEWLGSREPDRDNLLKYIAHMQKRYQDSTITHELGVIRKGYKVNDWPWPLVRGDTPRPKERDIRRPQISVSRLEQMVEVVLGLRPVEGRKLPDSRHKAFLCVSMIWGLRRIEMQSIQPSFLDIDNRTIFIPTAKFGVERYHVVPEFAIPFLRDWHFRHRLSDSAMDEIFNDLKKMVGFTGPDSYGVGWHSVRRAAVDIAGDIFTEKQIFKYFRWKNPEDHQMPAIYASGVIVGDESEAITIPAEYRKLDMKVYEFHPLCILLKEKLEKSLNAKRNT